MKCQNKAKTIDMNNLQDYANVFDGLSPWVGQVPIQPICSHFALSVLLITDYGFRPNWAHQ